MFDLLRHPRLPAFARTACVSALAVFTFTAFAQYRQTGPVVDERIIFDHTQNEATGEATVVSPEMPDFESLGDVDTRKEAFFEFLSSYVENENRRIAATRAELMPMWEVVRDGMPLSAVEQERFAEIAAEYRLDDADLSSAEGRLSVGRELVRRVDVLPKSLVLAQAANESGWGTSRFAREGNNIFGQWCFDEGCGLVPRRRGESRSHEVRAFASVQASVRAYFRNLNTHRSYEDLRVLREAMRMRDMPLDSLVLARGLTRYSERGQAYVSELQDIIRINQLRHRDKS